MAKNFEINYDNAKANDASIFKGQKYRISVLSELLIRIEYSESGTFEDRPTELAIFRNFDKPTMQVEDTGKILNITTNYFKLSYLKEANIPKSNSSSLKIKLINTDKEWTITAPEVRNFYGTLPSLDDIEGKVPLLKGLYSSDGYVTVDDSKSLIFGEDKSLLKSEGERFDKYVFMYRKDFGNCLRDYFKLTGYPPMIPRYAFGVWWNKNTTYTSSSLRDLVDNFAKYQIPISTVVFGENWHIRNVSKHVNLITGYSFNRELFPKPDEFISYLHSKDIYLGLKINPSQGIMPHEENYSKLREALNKEDGVPIPYNTYDVAYLKLYFEYIVKPLYNMGVNFLWIDYYNKDNLSSLRALNYYHYMDSIIDKKKRGLILSRNGLTAAHRYPVHYSGQTIVSWNVLKFLPYFNISATNSGIAYWSHDVGGYKNGFEDSELYIRYVQLGTFSSIFRFSSKDGKYYKREPWKWEAKTLSIVREYTRLRHQLIPYLYSESYKYHKNGLPFIQPIYYKYPTTYDDPSFLNEYFFGSELLVCPITNKIDDLMKRVVERTFIPEGIWYEFKSGKKVPGGKIYRLFYKEEDYPVFAKSGAIIPLAIIDEKKPNYTGVPSSLEIHVFPGQSNTYNLYEDDGVSTLYEEGHYLNTEIKYAYQPNNFSLAIKPTDGMEGLVPEKRTYKIRFRNTKYPQKVDVRSGGSALNVPCYTDGKDFIVEVPFTNAYAELYINCSGNDIEIDAVKLVNEDIDLIISDLLIETTLKEKLSSVLFGVLPINKKRIEIRKLKREGLSPLFVKLFLRLLEYISEI